MKCTSQMTNLKEEKHIYAFSAWSSWITCLEHKIGPFQNVKIQTSVGEHWNGWTKEIVS